MSLEETNKNLTAAFFEAMQRADADAIADAYCEEIRSFAAGVLDAFPEGLAFTVHTMTAEGDRVAVEATSAGRHVSGRDYRNQYHFLFTWKEGRIIELKEYMDTELVTDVLCGGARP